MSRTVAWAPSAAVRAAGGVVVLLLVGLDLLTDAPGRLLVTPLAVGVALAVVRVVVLSPLLAAGPDGLRVVRGLGVLEVGWPALVGARVVRHRGRALELDLEVDGEPVLVVLGALSLGAEPERVLAELLAVRPLGEAAGPQGDDAHQDDGHRG